METSHTEPIKDKHIVCPREDQGLRRRKALFGLDEAIEENEIILDFEGKGIESKLNSEVGLPIVSQTHFYPLCSSNLVIEVNINQQLYLHFQ